MIPNAKIQLRNSFRPSTTLVSSSWLNHRGDVMRASGMSSRLTPSNDVACVQTSAVDARSRDSNVNVNDVEPAATLLSAMRLGRGGVRLARGLRRHHSLP